jgi:hypothetical protein
MAKPGTKKQHYIPQLLLRRFADARETLQVYDKATDRSYGTSVRDAGHQNHFLSIPELDGDDGPGAVFEPFFQTIEGPAATAIDRVVNAAGSGVLHVIDDDARVALALFIALQYIRTPAARDLILEYMEATRRTMEQLGQEIARRNGFGRRIRKRVTFEWNTDDPTKMHASFGLQPKMIEELAVRLIEGHWYVLVNNTTRGFYLSDNPVGYHCHVDREGRGVGLGTYSVEVSLPLTPRYVLLIVEARYAREQGIATAYRDGHLYGTDRLEHIDWYRSLQVNASRRFVFALERDFELAAEMCRADPKVRSSKRDQVVGYFGGERIY